MKDKRVSLVLLHKYINSYSMNNIYWCHFELKLISSYIFLLNDYMPFE